MDLFVLYTKQEQKRKEEVSFYGFELTPFQTNLYNTLKDKATKGVLVSPYSVNAKRGAGKTLVLLKLAKDLDIPLVELNTPFAQALQREYPDITIVSQHQLNNLRGRRVKDVLVDEGVDIECIHRAGFSIATGFINYH